MDLDSAAAHELNWDTKIGIDVEEAQTALGRANIQTVLPLAASRVDRRRRPPDLAKARIEVRQIVFALHQQMQRMLKRPRQQLPRKIQRHEPRTEIHTRVAGHRIRTPSSPVHPLSDQALPPPFGIGIIIR